MAVDEYTAFGWPVAPEGLTEVLVQLRDRYGDRLPPAEAAGFLGAMHLMRDVVTKLNLYFSTVK